MSTTVTHPDTRPVVPAALAGASGPPRPPGRAAASFTFLGRSLLRIRHVPEQLFDVTMIPILFTLMFTYLFGGALAGSTDAYLHDLLPGTLVLTVLLVGVFTGVGLNTDLNTGIFDRFRSMPIWRPAPIIGALLGDAARNLLAASIVITLGLVMGFRPDGGVVGLLAGVGLLLVFAFALGWVWCTLALVLRTSSAVSTVSLLVTFPLTFASNVFVDPTTMPGWLERLVSVNPVSRLVDAVRGLAHGSVSSAAILWTLAAAGVLLAVFVPLTVRLYRGRS